MASTRPNRAPKAIARPKFGYDFKQLLDFPRRLIFPPDAGVGAVRSLKITPRYQVNLNDVLDGKYLPPLTLKDFEEYLVFHERSAENLYFICWLRDYTTKYTEWQHSLSESSIPPAQHPKSLPDLTLSWSRAKATFFNNQSHLELNLPSRIIDDCLNNTKANAHPSPGDLAAVQQQVEGMLHESLMRFVSTACANSGRRRGLFAIFVGALVIAIGLIPVLLSIYRGESRGIRLAGLPAFWFGATTAIAGFHGVCVVIFLFGDARQLFPYELARPLLEPLTPLEPLSLPMPVTTPGSFGMTGDVSTLAASDEDRDVRNKITVSSQYSADDKAILPHSRSQSSGGEDKISNAGAIPSEWDSYLPDTAGFIPQQYPGSISSTTLTSTAYAYSTDKDRKAALPGSNSGASSAFHFDFDQLPPSPRNPRASAEYGGSSSDDSSSFLKRLPVRGTFCRMTKVLEPLCSRAQWEIVMRSALMAVFVAVLFGGIMFAIPYRHHH